MSWSSFPLAVPFPGPPLPSAGSGGSVPLLLRYCGGLRLPASPHASVVPRASVPAVAPSFAPPPVALTRWPGAWLPVAPTGLLSGEDGGSQVSGVPLPARPALRPRPGLGGVCRPGATSVLPPLLGTVSAPAMCTVSGLYHTAHRPAVYASPLRSLDGARLASGCWLGFARQASSSCWAPLQGFSSRSSSLSRLSWRTPSPSPSATRRCDR